MNINKLAGIIIFMMFISSCSSGNPTETEGVYIKPLFSENLPEFPANSLGSSYKEMIYEIMGGAKDQFETFAEHEARISNLPSFIEKKYGKYFVFRLDSIIYGDMAYDAEKRVLYYSRDLSNGVFSNFYLGSDDSTEVKTRFSINPENCMSGFRFNISPNLAREITESTDYAYFITGKIDFSREGYVPPNKAKIYDNEKVPGLKSMRLTVESGIATSLDFKADRFLIVNLKDGSVVSQSNCSS
jgi:hypothetical protein